MPLDSGEDGHFLILQMGKLRPRAGLSHGYRDKDIEDDDHNGDTMLRLDYRPRHCRDSVNVSCYH